jgi:hypothetical protein
MYIIVLGNTVQDRPGRPLCQAAMSLKEGETWRALFLEYNFWPQRGLAEQASKLERELVFAKVH